MAPKHTLDPDLEADLRDRLEDLLDEADDVADKKKRVASLLGGHLKVVKERISLTRRQLKGQDLDEFQVEIPGTERPSPAADPLVQGILELAGGIVVRKPGDEDVPPLEWQEDGSTYRAVVDDGIYLVEEHSGGGYTVRWSPAKGREKTLLAGQPLEACQAEARKHQLERAGDALLKNAGAGDLTKSDTKGPAVARKRGRR